MAQTRLQYLLGKLAEEAAEVAQIANKAKDFGLDEVYIDVSNVGRLHLELNDLQTIVKMLNDEFELAYEFDQDAMCRKIKKVDKYYDYSQSLGLTE